MSRFVEGSRRTKGSNAEGLLSAHLHRNHSPGQGGGHCAPGTGDAGLTPDQQARLNGFLDHRQRIRS